MKDRGTWTYCRTGNVTESPHEGRHSTHRQQELDKLDKIVRRWWPVALGDTSCCLAVWAAVWENWTAAGYICPALGLGGPNKKDEL